MSRCLLGELGESVTGVFNSATNWALLLVSVFAVLHVVVKLSDKPGRRLPQPLHLTSRGAEAVVVSHVRAHYSHHRNALAARTTSTTPQASAQSTSAAAITWSRMGHPHVRAAVVVHGKLEHQHLGVGRPLVSVRSVQLVPGGRKGRFG